MTQRAPSAVSLRLLAAAATTAYAALIASSPAAAQVITTGSVTPAGISSGDTVSTISVGDQGAASTSLFGALDILNGSTLQATRLIAGQQEEYIGDVVVSGPGSTLTLTGSGTSSAALEVGDEGTGFLTVSDRAVLELSNNNGTLVVGNETSGFGIVTVEGQRTQLLIGDAAIIGDQGHGELTLRNGARIAHPDGDSGLLDIGATATGSGVVTVDGERSFWQLPQTTRVGVLGVGSLRVSNGATVDSDNRFTGASVTVGPRGVVELDDARFLSAAITLNGRFEGDGQVTGGVTINAGGELHAGPGDVLRLADTVDNAGLINVTGVDDERGEIEFFGATTNAGGAPLPGRIAVGNGVVRFNSPLTNDGTLASTSGTTDFHGTITNGAAGLIAIGGQSNATFFDTVDVTGGTLNIATGSTALFLGDITISPGSTLAITIDESALEPGFDTPLQVLGATTLGAPITLELADDFLPAPGDMIPLVSTAGGLILDTLEPNNFEPLPDGLVWDVVITEEGIAAVVSDVAVDPGGGVLDGDYNGDNIVDVADFTVWRDSLGAMGGNLAADGDGSGTVDVDDYLIWQENFGRERILATPAANVAPEPSALVLLLLGAVGAALRRR